MYLRKRMEVTTSKGRSTSVLQTIKKLQNCTHVGGLYFKVSKFD